MPNMKGITVRIDAGLHAEIKAYLEEHEMTMGEFIALAALDELHPRSMGLDPELQAEVMAHLEGSETSLDGFITQAVQNELHPKTPELEENSMYRENMRTLAIQVPESLFQRVKQYLERNNMTQKAFVLGLIEDELDRDEELLRKQQEEAKTAEEEEQDEGISEGGEAPVSEEPLEVEVGDEPEEAPAVGDFEGSFDEAAEEEPGRDSIEDEPEYDEDTEPDEMDAPDESPGYGDDMDAEPAPAAEDTLGLDNGAVFAEVEGGSFPEQSEQENTPDAAQDDAPPDREYVDGELGAAIEVAPSYDFGDEPQPPFPEPEDEEDQDFGMSMGY